MIRPIFWQCEYCGRRWPFERWRCNSCGATIGETALQNAFMAGWYTSTHPAISGVKIAEPPGGW